MPSAATRPPRAGVRRALAGAAILPLLAACALQQPADTQRSPAEAAPVSLPLWQVPAPPPLRGHLFSPDLLVWAPTALSDRDLRRISRIPGVRASTAVAVASVPVEGRTLVVAGVDPAGFRRFTDKATASSLPLWQRVAAGDVALTQAAAKAVQAELGGTLLLQAQPVPVGALANSIPTVDAVMNLGRAASLGMPVNGAVLSVRGPVDAVGARLQRRIPGIGFQQLDSTTDAPVFSGRLVGGSLGDAIGSFTYRWFADGSVAPDPRWVAANIRTETVPILGQMTCHRAIFPQLKAALREIERTGLAGAIHPSEYAGCYHPRFIASDPSQGLSLHTFGIAFDLNVPGNQRGTAGEMDRGVVEIFKRWGFAWGGDWSYTDPMHFELAVLLQP